VDGFEVALSSLFEGGDGKFGKRVLEAQHSTLGEVLLVC
jgi:hypothetical protein